MVPERTVIFSLYSSNILIFRTETECVHCAVRTDYKYSYDSVKQNSLQVQYSLNKIMVLLLEEKLLPYFHIEFHTFLK
jgi:hypothetical protein